jgi:hypothetical protein
MGMAPGLFRPGPDWPRAGSVPGGSMGNVAYLATETGRDTDGCKGMIYMICLFDPERTFLGKEDYNPMRPLLHICLMFVIIIPCVILAYIYGPESWR